MESIYHIAQRTDWDRALSSGNYTALSLNRAGFIHCSLRRQLLGVANSHFHGVQDLVLLHIEPTELKVEVRFENLDGGDDLYPHVYGSIPCSAVSAVTAFTPRLDGGFDETALP